MSRRFVLKGYRLGKDGKRVARDPRRLNVSAQLKQRGSKKVRVARKGQTR